MVVGVALFGVQAAPQAHSYEGLIAAASPVPDAVRQRLAEIAGGRGDRRNHPCAQYPLRGD